MERTCFSLDSVNNHGTNNKRRASDVYGDDCIDWDEAIRITEEKVGNSEANKKALSRPESDCHIKSSSTQLSMPTFHPNTVHNNKLKEKRNSDIYGDDSIDWEQALQIMDKKLSSTSYKTGRSSESTAQSSSHGSSSVSCVKQETGMPLNRDGSNIQKCKKFESIRIAQPKQSIKTNSDSNNNLEKFLNTGRTDAANIVATTHQSKNLAASFKSKATDNNQLGSQIPKVLKLNTVQQSMSSIRPKEWKKGPLPTSLPVAKNNDPRLPPELQFSADILNPVQDKHRQDLVKNANLSEPLLNGWTLYSHQKKAILRALLMRRMICSLDMGLGKTLIGCVWAKSFCKVFNCKVILICPVSLKKEWKRTLEEATGLTVEDDKATDNEQADVQIFSWAKIPTDVNSYTTNYIVLCDEAHSIQSMQSARTKDTLKLVKPKRCIGVLLLTGTPMKNGKPSNLFPLLRAICHPLGKNQKAYEKHFCAGHEQRFGRGPPVWKANGSSNLNQLRGLVSSHMIHLTKEQCLTDLPPKTRSTHHVPVSHRMQIKHNNALSELGKIYNTSSTMENNGDAILGAVQRVRFVGSLARIDASVELAKKILEQEPAIVVFTSFVDVAKSIHRKLADSGWEGEILTGETPAKKRQGMVDNFQNGLSPVFVCTFGAGGVGLTLTAACTVVLVDRPWTPGDADQAEDRVRRIGQTKPVKCIWMSSFDLDKQIDAILEQKKQTSNAVLTAGADGNAAAGYAPSLSIFSLLKSILPANNNQMSQSSMNSYFQPFK